MSSGSIPRGDRDLGTSPLGHSVYVSVKWRPARDSLIKRINSLMARFNSLLVRNKFPVPARRELNRKPLNLALDSEPIIALEGPRRTKFPVFSQLAGNSGFQRRVRSRLPPPARSPLLN